MAKTLINKVINKGRRFFCIGLASLMPLAYSAGCFPPETEESNRSNNDKNFFLCNDIVDRNQDMMIEKGELEGIKDFFNPNEKIIAVASIENKKGNFLTTKVYDYKSNLVGERKQIISTDAIIIYYGFDPWELYNISGAGTYNVEWYLNDNHLIAKKGFTLSN